MSNSIHLCCPLNLFSIVATSTILPTTSFLSLLDVWLRYKGDKPRKEIVKEIFLEENVEKVESYNFLTYIVKRGEE